MEGRGLWELPGFPRNALLHSAALVRITNEEGESDLLKGAVCTFLTLLKPQKYMFVERKHINCFSEK